MAQLTVYIDEATRAEIEEAARNANTSVSQWVKSKLCAALQTDWPPGYFDLLGSLAESDLERPSQGSFDDDARRRELD